MARSSQRGYHLVLLLHFPDLHGGGGAVHHLGPCRDCSPRRRSSCNSGNEDLKCVGLRVKRYLAGRTSTGIMRSMRMQW